MRFSIFALATSASALAVAPRSDYGSWDFTGGVSFPANGMTTMNIDATFNNADLAAPIEVSCTYLYTPGAEPKEEASCTDPSFSYDFHGIRMAATTQNVTLSQTVDLNGEKVTVYGTKEFKWDFSSGSGRSGSVKGNIPVDSAIA